MKKIIAGSLAALTAGAALAGAAPASARDWHHGRGDAAGAALVAGVAGLAIGAALADNHRGYERPYYGSAYYGPEYYGRAYYARPYYAYPRCRTEWRWDPRWGDYARVRVCY